MEEPRHPHHQDQPARRARHADRTARFFHHLGDNRCDVTGDDLVDARGYARELSPISGLSVRSSGEIWASRQLELDGAKQIDVFDAEGGYLGTLPEEFPFPIAWQSEQAFLTFGFSEVGVPFVVGLRLVENGRSERRDQEMRLCVCDTG